MNSNIDRIESPIIERVYDIIKTALERLQNKSDKNEVSLRFARNTNIKEDTVSRRMTNRLVAFGWINETRSLVSKT